MISRRTFVRGAALIGAIGPSLVLQSAEPGVRKMKICLTPGSVGVSANQEQTIALAARFGFEAVEPFASFLANLKDDAIESLRQRLAESKLVWGAAGLSVEFRQDDSRFRESMAKFPQQAAALQKAGVTRVGTWLTPASDSIPYIANFKQHVDRLREAAIVLKDHGQRLGLEYVGTFTSRARRKYGFIHSMAEMKELIEEIGTGNVGFILDSWHWWQAGDSAADILTLRDQDVISVDLNDAPAGIAKDQQLDGKRELPAATGVIDHAAFLKALQKIDYSGPVRAEPFNKAVNDLDNETACQTVAAAMRKAFGALEQ